MRNENLLDRNATNAYIYTVMSSGYLSLSISGGLVLILALLARRQDPPEG
jgi:hypothetical protein